MSPRTSQAPGNAPAMGHARAATTAVWTEQDTDQKGVFRIGLWAGADDEFDESDDDAEPAAESSAPHRRDGGRAGRSRLRAVKSPEPYRGRYAWARPAREPVRDVAWDATLLRAAERGALDGAGGGPRHAAERGSLGAARRDAARHETAQHDASPRSSVQVDADDLCVRVRVRRPAQLLLFVVDGSGSMGEKLTDYARQMAASALSDAYLKRASVAMIVFRERTAELSVGATRKIDLVRGAFDDLPLGGTTPLAAALRMARRTLERELGRDRGLRPTLILISDGRANVGSVPGHEGVLAEVRSVAKGIAGMRGVRALFLDTTEAGKDARRAAAIAGWLGAERVRLSRHSGRDPSALARLALERWSMT